MRELLRRLISFVVVMNLKLFTFVTKRPRARVLVSNEKGQILLLRAYISHGKWTLPGGALNRGETAAQAARRELHEETGITADVNDLTYLATLAKPEYDIPFTAPVYALRVMATALPERLFSPREVQEIAWFDRDALPTPLSDTVTHALELERRALQESQ